MTSDLLLSVDEDSVDVSPPARPGDPGWVRPALFGLLAVTAVLYLWDLGASGWANSFYSAAVQAGTQSWKAMFFGSSDAANLITVDKPPASLWVMEISARLFGVNAWSILVPQALEGVAGVAVLFATVRRWFGPAAGLIAGAVLALTPVAALMFRFNNPDALLVLLLILGAWATTRAVERASVRWLMLGAAFVGLGFLAKSLQAFLVVPAFAAMYLLAAPTSFRKRILHLLAAGGALLAASGWWVAIVELWPASSRPYIGGSQNNSVLDLIFGYNGLGRITGNETGSVTAGGGAAGGAPGGGTSMWGATGWSRLFNSEFGGQVSWLIATALVLMVASIWLSVRSARTDRLRAATVLWGGWLLVTGAIISFGQGIIHPYYTVALAPAIGALIGIGATAVWKQRGTLGWRLVLSGTMLATVAWSSVLLGRSADWQPWLRPTVVVLGVAVAVALLAVDRLPQRLALGVAGAALVAGLAGPAAYSVQTATTAHSGSIPSAGPTVAGAGFGPGRGGAGGPGGAFGPGGAGGPGGLAGPGGAAGGTMPTMPGGAAGTGGFPTGGALGGTGGGTGGGAGGLLNASAPSAELVTLLQTNASSYTWVAAAVGANSAAGYQLSTGDPVMSLGGFNGSDPYPTLAQFQQYVASGKVHYFIAGGGMGQANGGSNATSEISTWVSSNFTAVTVGGTTVYDLTQPTTPSTTGTATTA